MAFLMDEALTEAAIGRQKIYKKNEIVIEEGRLSDRYCYLKNGELDVFNFTEDGKEFLQHKVTPQHFFAEPAVLLGQPFPGNARVATETAEIYFFNKNDFENFLLENPSLMLEFAKSIAEKSIRKSATLKNIVFQCPEQRVMNQLLEYKKEKGKEHEKTMIQLTRKELSNMTGLRIETVIRTVKKMETDKKLELRNGKIFC